MMHCLLVRHFTQDQVLRGAAVIRAYVITRDYICSKPGILK